MRASRVDLSVTQDRLGRRISTLRFLAFSLSRAKPYYTHLTGAFEDDDVTHVEGDVNPVRDLDIISEELRLKDVEFLNTHLEKLEKLVIRGNDKKLKPEYVSIELRVRPTR
jgi:hypothetical protein